MHRENREFNASGDIAGTSATQETAHCFAKSAGRRHIILKERLMRKGSTVMRRMARGGRNSRANHAETFVSHGIFGG